MNVDDALGERLSFAEARLWRGKQPHPDTTAFVECPRHVPLVVRLVGSLDIDRLSACIAAVAERQEVLRSRFIERDGRPVRRLASSADIAMARTDLSALSSEQRDAAVTAALVDEVNRPFDLERGPLMRARVLALDRREHIVALVVHHVSTDGWSKHILGRQIASAYAQGEDTVDERSATMSGYGAYVRDQHEFADSDRGRTLLKYWETRLAGAVELVLPGDLGPAADASTRGAIARFAISPEHVEGFKRLAKQCGATPSVTITTLFKVILHRLTGIDDLVIGMPTSDRNRPGFENVVGLFLNLAVLRTDLSGDPTFIEAVQRVRRTFMDTYDHSDLPYTIVQGAVNCEQGRPLPLRVVFNFASVRGGAALVLPDTTAETIDIDVNTPSCADLSMHIFDRAGAMTGFVLYQAERFSPQYIGSLIGLFQSLLGEVLAAPERRISDYLPGRLLR